jgi:hypothetical protein
MLLAEHVKSARAIAVVGLAKNTGKTTALGVMTVELHGRGRTLGVTSAGRDGEPFDVLDPRIHKPAVTLPAGSFVATSASLLRESGAAHAIVMQSRHRTPLGRVVVARLLSDGPIEVAGPVTVSGIREVCSAMRSLGADHVLVDGSIDRRAVASPTAVDAVVLATGASVDEDKQTVIDRTQAVVQFMTLPPLTDSRVRKIAAAHRGSVLVTADDRAMPADPRLGLGSYDDTAGCSYRSADVRWMLIRGALVESFVQSVLPSGQASELTLVVEHAANVFLSTHNAQWYRDHGVLIRPLKPISLRAVVVNPIAPGSHELDSSELRQGLAEAIATVPIIDVRDPAYGVAQ